MTLHTPIPSGRIIAPGGPVSVALRALRAAHDLPPLLAEHFDREAGEIAELRQAIRRQLETDFDRIDRCLVILDALDGDADLEAEDEHGGDVQDEPHDPEEDKGAEEDEGPAGYYHRDRSQLDVARAARTQLDAIVGRRRRAGSGGIRLIGPCGSAFVARRM